MAIAAALVVSVAAAAHAQSPTPAADREFARSVIEAINGKSLERRKALLHPRSLACATAEATAFRDELIADQQSRNDVPPKPRWSIRPQEPGPPIFVEMLDYPLKPTHWLDIESETGTTSVTTVSLQLVRDGNAWREVFPCPKPETIAEARAARAAQPRREARIQALLDQMPPTLKDDVLRRLRDGREIDAILYYQTATGEDLATAKDVVERLKP